MAQGIPWFVPSTVLERVNRKEVDDAIERISTYHIRADGAVEITTAPGQS